MTLQEKIDMVRGDVVEGKAQGLFLFRRGLFLVLYEESAYLYHHLELPGAERAKCKKIKSLEGTMLQLFISISEMSELEARYPLQEVRDGVFYYTLEEPLDLSDYEAWRDKICADKSRRENEQKMTCRTPIIKIHRVSDKEETRKHLSECKGWKSTGSGLPTGLSWEESEVLYRLRHFDLRNCTPLDAALFLVELQKLLGVL